MDMTTAGIAAGVDWAATANDDELSRIASLQPVSETIWIGADDIALAAANKSPTDEGATDAVLEFWEPIIGDIPWHTEETQDRDWLSGFLKAAQSKHADRLLDRQLE